MTDGSALAPRDLLAKEIGSLVQRLRTWTPTRWAAAVEPWGTRADLARHVAQYLADVTAALEDAPRRILPVLGADLLVVDQLAIAGDDLARCSPSDDLCAAVVAHLLLHRHDLLSEEPPDSLGGAAALVRGREICEG